MTNREKALKYAIIFMDQFADVDDDAIPEETSATEFFAEMAVDAARVFEDYLNEPID